MTNEINDFLEEMKVKSALRSENLKLAFRKTNNPKEISVLDYTVIEALKKQIATEVNTKEVNNGMDISGEYDISFYMLCPTCDSCVGNYEMGDLWGDYCPICGQKLKYTEQDED